MFSHVQPPVIAKEFAAVSCVDFSQAEPHDFAVTSGSRVRCTTTPLAPSGVVVLVSCWTRKSQFASHMTVVVVLNYMYCNDSKAVD